MVHGVANANKRWDPEPRGGSEVFVTGWLMAQARRQAGPGWISFEAMGSLEPLMGPNGYTLLLQTGETADGVTPLVDRQHPHDAFMAIGASYHVEIEEGAWAFLYVAPIGSPALGPVPFMHRASGAANLRACNGPCRRASARSKSPSSSILSTTCTA
jgi:hypothetical protein